MAAEGRKKTAWRRLKRSARYRSGLKVSIMNMTQAAPSRPAMTTTAASFA